jgi:hypothetical protein
MKKATLVILLLSIGTFICACYIFYEKYNNIQFKQINDYYDNGNIKANYFVNGKGSVDSVFISYYENGNKQIDGFFRDNELCGRLSRYYENGGLECELFYIDGRTNFYNYWYAENQTIRTTEYHIDDTSYHASTAIFDSGCWREVKEKYLPRVRFNKDTIFVGDTIFVYIHCPLPHSEFDRDRLFVKFAVVKDYMENEKYIVEDSLYSKKLMIPKQHFGFIARKVDTMVFFGEVYDTIPAKRNTVGTFERKFIIYPRHPLSASQQENR